MAKLDTATKARLGKLVLLLSSDQMGEVNSAAAAIRRTLNGAGADLHDLAAAIKQEGGGGEVKTKIVYVNVPGPERVVRKKVIVEKIVEKIVYRDVEKIVYRDRDASAEPQASLPLEQRPNVPPRPEYEQAPPDKGNYVRVWKMSSILIDWDEKHDVLTKTERDFVDKQHDRAQSYRQRLLISVKQVDWLESMLNRHVPGWESKV